MSDSAILFPTGYYFSADFKALFGNELLELSAVELSERAMANSISKEVVSSLRDGDHQAFESVFFHYFKKVKYFINGLIKSDDDAEELAQDVFVKIWTTRESIDTDKNFNTYVYIIARNTTISFLKQKYVR